MKEQEDISQEPKVISSTTNKEEPSSIVIPVVQEQISIEKEMIETGKVIIHKQVTEEQATVNVPLIQEGYDVERIAVKKVVDTPPSVRYEGDNIIIPVMREILVVEKRYEILEEIHVVKRKTEVPHKEEITLRKENITVERRKASENPDNSPAT